MWSLIMYLFGPDGAGGTSAKEEESGAGPL